MQLQNSNSKPNTESQTENSPVEVLQNWLVVKLAEQLSVKPETIDTSESLTRYGLDSIDAVTLVGDLEDWLELELPSTLFWDYPTIEKSSEFLVTEFDVSSAIANADSEESVPAEQPKEKEKSGKGWGGLWKGLSGS
ncbi:MAG: acyl carrier protein [Cyanobacteriota bacterium]|nr:acyl carrier protein [Cyanobacteriota bacterium]